MQQKNLQVDLETWEKLKELSFYGKIPMSKIIKECIDKIYEKELKENGRNIFNKKQN